MIVVNSSHRLAPWADALHAGDARWWRTGDVPSLDEFEGERWTLDPELAHDPNMHQIEGIDEPGISEHPGRIHTGGNSGYQAIGLAALWGASRIVLLGYDMGAAGRLHWHADHDARNLGNPTHTQFAQWRARLTVAARDLRRLGVEVVNCSRASTLTCFERDDLAHTLVH